MTADERQAALRAALSGDLSGWQGLPEACGPEDFAVLSGDEGALREARISGIPTAARDYSGQPGPLRVFLDQDDHAYLVWADWDVPVDVAALGEPEARLDESRRPGTAQWVWARRGVTAYVDAGGAVRGLALYLPTDAEYYRTSLGGTEGQPYRPRR